MQLEHSNNYPTTKTHSRLMLVIILNLLALFGAVFLFLLIRQKNERAWMVNNDLEAALVQKSNIQLLEKTVNSVQVENQKLSSFLVAKDDLVSFLGRIDELGQATHCTTKVTTVEEVKDGQIAKLHLIVEAGGSWMALHTFFSALLSIPYEIEVKGASFVSSIEGEKAAARRVWTATFNFTVAEQE